MKEAIAIVDDVIHQLCGCDDVKGYGLDEWSPPIHNLKALRQRLERIADNNEPGALSITGNPKLWELVNELKSMPKISTTYVLKVLYLEFPQLQAGA